MGKNKGNLIEFCGRQSISIIFTLNIIFLCPEENQYKNKVENIAMSKYPAEFETETHEKYHYKKRKHKVVRSICSLHTFSEFQAKTKYHFNKTKGTLIHEREISVF